MLLYKPLSSNWFYLGGKIDPNVFTTKNMMDIIKIPKTSEIYMENLA